MQLCRAFMLIPLFLLMMAVNQCESEDMDHDGWSIDDGDCNDEDDTVYPGANEICNGIDNDCDDTLADETCYWDEAKWGESTWD